MSRFINFEEPRTLRVIFLTISCIFLSRPFTPLSSKLLLNSEYSTPKSKPLSSLLCSSCCLRSCAWRDKSSSSNISRLSLSSCISLNVSSVVSTTKDSVVAVFFLSTLPILFINCELIQPDKPNPSSVFFLSMLKLRMWGINSPIASVIKSSFEKLGSLSSINALLPTRLFRSSYIAAIVSSAPNRCHSSLVYLSPRLSILIWALDAFLIPFPSANKYCSFIWLPLCSSAFICSLSDSLSISFWVKVPLLIFLAIPYIKEIASPTPAKSKSTPYSSFIALLVPKADIVSRPLFFLALRSTLPAATSSKKLATTS